MADSEQVLEVQNGPSQSKVVLAKPRLGGFGGGGSSSGGECSKSSTNLFDKAGSGSGSVLRPSQLKPGTNPFLRLANPETDTKAEPPVDERLKEPAKEDTEAPKFVPLGATTVIPSNPVPSPAQPAASSSSGFVFGQNLSARVMVSEAANGSTSVDHSSTNGNSELLFTSAVASNAENNQEEGSSSVAGRAGEGLAAAAAEYERSHARQPVLAAAAAPTTTGEEDETNVLQVTCRLFAWEAGSWRERGRGVLRLNDCATGGSRLVCRVLGSLRVVLNTKVWPEMVADRASAKSLRITATDAHQHVKVFLVMATQSDVVHLHRELTSRISQASCQKGATPVDAHRVAPPHVTFVDDDSCGPPPDDAFYDGDLRPLTENGACDDRESQTLKRKEADTEDATSPKRQCPEIITTSVE